MSFKEKIKELREASENNRLIIFVGAGVSNNSGIPGWNELVKCFAQKLNYDKCKKCNFHSSNCQMSDCKEKYNFCQDDYLKIPQFFYNKDENEYFKTIKEFFNIDAQPNLINNILIDLHPKHIITTNFDNLIENTNNPNTMVYKVITKDKDLLTYKSNNSYIIKMHGDINEIKEIVLMENDYLNYSQKHILIETFIKSLLIDCTFLFIGYSLNDYNLKLIISWFEYLAKGCEKAQRQKNYIVTDGKEKYIEKYFSKNNIITINPSEIPILIKKKHSKVQLKEKGKSIYAVLDCILHRSNDYLLGLLLDVLYERYQIFKNRKRISFEELKNLYSFGSVDRLEQELRFNDKFKFDSLKELLMNTSEKTDFIKTIFVRTGIELISCDKDFLELKILDYKNEFNILLETEQQNDYINALLQADTLNDDMAKSYYFYLTDLSSDKLSQSMERIKKDLLQSDDYFKLLIFEFNKYCLLKLRTWKSQSFQDVEKILKNIPDKFRKSFIYFEKIFEGNYDNIIRCNELANKCLKIYTDINTTYFGEIKNDELLKIQALSYDYYYYFKINNLMIDYFTDSKNILEPYVKAMLCTYFPQIERKSFFLGLKSSIPKKYFLNTTDLDILIKHTNLDKLKLFVNDFKIKELRFKQDVKVTAAFLNLCKSITKFPKTLLISYLKTYLFLITKFNTDDFDINAVYIALSDLLFKKDLLKNNILFEVFDELRSFLQVFKENIDKEVAIKFIDFFSDRDIISYCRENSLYITGIFKLLSKYTNNKINEKTDELINETDGVTEKIKIINSLHVLFNESQKELYMHFIRNNIKSIPTDHLYAYISKGYLKYGKIIKERYLQALEDEVKKRKEKPGQRSMPDYLLQTIDELIILFLLKKIRSLENFRYFSEYSEHLSFLLNPESYDYSKIQNLDYMWENFLRYKKYRKILVKNGSKIKEDLEKAVQDGRATESQKAILFRYFLSEEETYKYI